MQRIARGAWRWVGAVALLLGCGLTGWAEKPADLARPQGYVADFAGVLDAASIDHLTRLGHELLTKANARIEVVTVHNTGGESIDAFATELEDKWKVGDAKLHRGALIILAIDDRKRRVEVGDGLEGVLNDAKVGDMQRAATDQLRAGQYGAAAFTIESAMAAAVAKDAGVTLDPAVMAGTSAPGHQYHREDPQEIPPWVGVLVIVGMVFFIILASVLLGRFRSGGGGMLGFLLGMLFSGGGRGGGWSDGGGGWSGGGGFSGGDSGGGSSGGGNDDAGWGGGSSGGGESGSW